ncbi:MAG TPA: rod shape-determining protein [Clostridia bacterium]|jgi:rod shape-determining protein MreB|nr:rod shape-determining protein [Clostridia bacterium]
MRNKRRRGNTVIIEMGSANITVLTDAGIVREPSIAIVTRSHTLELLAYGHNAIKMIGKIPNHSYITHPVEEGVVTNVDAMSLIIKDILSKYLPKRFADSARVYVLIPCGLSIAERELMESAVVKAGRNDVTIIESMLGLLPYTKGSTLVALFGAGVTELGVIDETGIVTGLTVNLAGNTINDDIKTMALEKYNLKISSATAEKLKMGIGTLYENDTSTMDVIGQDIIDQKMRKIEIKAEHIRPSITAMYKKLVEVLESLLTTIPATTLAEISENGVLIAGGGAEMRGLTDFLARYLYLPVKVAPRPTIATVNGMSLIVNETTNKYEAILGNKR